MQNGQIIELFRNYITADRRYSPLTVRNYMRDVEEFVAWGEGCGEGFSLCEVKRDDI